MIFALPTLLLQLRDLSYSRLAGYILTSDICRLPLHSAAQQFILPSHLLRCVCYLWVRFPRLTDACSFIVTLRYGRFWRLSNKFESVMISPIGGCQRSASIPLNSTTRWQIWSARPLFRSSIITAAAYLHSHGWSHYDDSVLYPASQRPFGQSGLAVVWCWFLVALEWPWMDSWLLDGCVRMSTLCPFDWWSAEIYGELLCSYGLYEFPQYGLTRYRVRSVPTLGHQA